MPLANELALPALQRSTKMQAGVGRGVHLVLGSIDMHLAAEKGDDAAANGGNVGDFGAA